MDSRWKPINGCSRLRPHDEQKDSPEDQWQDDEMNEGHLDPTIPFKTDWEHCWEYIANWNCTRDHK